MQRIDRIITTSAVEAVRDLWEMSIGEDRIQIQKTRREFLRKIGYKK